MGHKQQCTHPGSPTGHSAHVNKHQHHQHSAMGTTVLLAHSHSPFGDSAPPVPLCGGVTHNNKLRTGAARQPQCADSPTKPPTGHSAAKQNRHTRRESAAMDPDYVPTLHGAGTISGDVWIPTTHSRTKQRCWGWRVAHSPKRSACAPSLPSIRRGHCHPHRCGCKCRHYHSVHTCGKWWRRGWRCRGFTPGATQRYAPLRSPTTIAPY